MLQFTIRDVLWLTVVGAIVVAWRIAHRSDVQMTDKERMVHAIQALETEGTIRALQEDYVALQRQLDAIRFIPRDGATDVSAKNDR